MREPEGVLHVDLRRLAALPDEDLIAEIRHAATVMDPPPPALLDNVRRAAGCDEDHEVTP